MNILFKRFALINILFLLISCAAPGGNENTTVLIKTTLGEIRIKLYDGTPIHRDNFIKLIKSGFYEGVSFHRVIKNFMIQAGDPNTRADKATLPDSLQTYTIPAEFNNMYFHKRGALAAAREGNDVNPEMRSSGTQFYIVQGVKYSEEELNQAEQRLNSNIKQAVFNQLLTETTDSVNLTGKTLPLADIQQIAAMKMYSYLASHKDVKIPEDRRIVYKNIGGVPRLDGTYTVFGEVIDGMDIVDRIAEVQTDDTDRPTTDIKILKVKIVNN
jgi:cyclophilin family peptidyl-prolyl cis-trans isomerase